MITNNKQRAATRLAIGLLTAAVGLMTFGCGSKKPVAFGTVTVDGKPVEKGAIQFFPITGEGQTAGTMLENGQYRVEVSPGPMKVVINAPKIVGKQKLYNEPDSPTVDAYKEQLPAKYSSVATSELKVVIEGQGGEFNFDLTIEKKK